MRALAQAGLRVPEDVAIVGFDDIPAASMTSPPLTTMVQDLKGAGALLIETLLGQIEGRDAPSPTLPTRLTIRRSSGARPAAAPTGPASTPPPS
jgi:DNA-binding LacI/PurR family transcriptional regulator